MTTLAVLERRVKALEVEKKASKPRLPWFLTFAEDLTDEEFEVEADWIFPMLLRSFLAGGTPGYPGADGPGGLVEHPEIAPLWQRWHAAYHAVMLRGTSPGRLYDLWSARGDAEQEQLRTQLAERLRALLPDGIGDLLTEWEPSSPETCTAWPSEAYFRWRDQKGSRSEQRGPD